MNVVAYRTVRTFIAAYPESETVMRDWYNALSKLEPQNFAELKALFPSVDAVQQKDGTIAFIFNLGGNKYRVVIRIDFEYKVAFILFVFTHTQYDKWNKRGRR